MVKAYSQEVANPNKAAKTSGSDLRIHYKNAYEVVRAIKHMSIPTAQKYLKDVVDHKRCIPFKTHTGCIGRTAQAKEFGVTQGRWPEKVVKVVLGLLQNLESNANVKSLDVASLYINHAQVNRAQKGRRRTYRAHGRINPYLNSCCHIELIASQKDENIAKAANKESKQHLTKRQIARTRVRVGEQ
ncbi:Ribosomal protein L22/L17 [Pseudocohnilembus persalinus]|uniref:Ribosomal protein L22/L17 n=1 Tax=Pseudocohnilembus persalinus TaxID=266149 RepID=A0A0V0QD39_PSEPJ|nr:Ribosomal protein L22/L17 [Pseudocohnilembus persalinus]|eukprot:KRX00125.1 Ribosomal protein L22/L17 [Pseudocohnilembus persalinus]